MSKVEKIIWQILRADSSQNIAFADLVYVLKNLGFEMHIKGSHHLFSKAEIEEIINLQPDGSKAKSYQVKQVRLLILKYQLLGE